MGADPPNDVELRRRRMEHFARLFAAKGETPEAPGDAYGDGQVHEPLRPAVRKAENKARAVTRPADKRQSEASGSIFSLLPPPAMGTQASDPCESFSQSTFICPKTFKTFLLEEKERQVCKMPVQISFVCDPQVVQAQARDVHDHDSFRLAGSTQSSSPSSGSSSPEFSPVTFAESLCSEDDAVLCRVSMHSVEGGPILQFLRAANGHQAF